MRWPRGSRECRCSRGRAPCRRRANSQARDHEPHPDESKDDVEGDPQRSDTAPEVNAIMILQPVPQQPRSVAGALSLEPPHPAPCLLIPDAPGPVTRGQLVASAALHHRYARGVEALLGHAPTLRRGGKGRSHPPGIGTRGRWRKGWQGVGRHAPTSIGHPMEPLDLWRFRRRYKEREQGILLR